MNAADHGTFTSNRYRRVEPIGAGAYGTVYKAIDCHTQQHVALKKIKIESEEEGIPSTAVREMCILRHLSHDNIVQLKDVIMDETQVILVFELEDTDLKKYLDRTTELLPMELVQSYSAQIICGLKYLHSMGVMHRDLKPQNILLSKEGVLKLADFGLSRAFTAYVRPLTAEHVITIWYRAPEVLLGATCYNASVDMWSAACVIAEMSSKKPLFSGSGEFDQLIKIFMQLGTPEVDNWPDIVNLPYWRNSFPDFFPYKWSHILPNLDEEGRDLISKILVFDPNVRLLAREALNHPFVRQYVVRTPMNLGSPREDRFGTPTNFDTASSSPRAILGIGKSNHVESRENNAAILSLSSSEVAVAIAASSSSTSSTSTSTSSSLASSIFVPPGNRTIKRSNSMPNPTIVNPNDGSVSHLNVNHLVNANTYYPTNIPKMPSHFQSKLVNQTSIELSNENHNIAGGSISHTGSKILVSTNKSSFSALPKSVGGVQSSLAGKLVPKTSGDSNKSGHNSKESNSTISISAKIDAKHMRPSQENLEQLDNSMIGLDESIEIDSGAGQFNQNNNSNSSNTHRGDSDLTDNNDSHLISTNSQRSTEDTKEDYINANISAALNRKQQVLNGGDRKFSRTRKPLQIVSVVATMATTAATTSAISSKKSAILATTVLSSSSSAKTYRVTESSPETVTSDNTSSALLLTSSLDSLDKSDGDTSSNVLFADNNRNSANKGLATGGVKTSNSSSNSSNSNSSRSSSRSNGGKKSSPSTANSKRKFQEPLEDNSSQKKHAGISVSICSNSSSSNSSSNETAIDPNKVYNESNFMKEAKHMAQLTEGVGRLTRRQSTFAGIK